LVDKNDVRLGDCGDDAWSELDGYLKAWREINFKFARCGSLFKRTYELWRIWRGQIGLKMKKNLKKMG